MHVSQPSSRAVATLVLAAVASAACGGATTPSPSSSPATRATASPTATVASVAAAADTTWIIADTSQATARVREQLVGVNAPSDAVLTATGAAGSFQLKNDGTFAFDSKISFDLTTLTSDQRQRDGFVKMDTLRVSQFPKAQLVPTKATGLTLPLPTTGSFTFTLTGTLTIHGVDKVVTFDVTAKRDGASLTATATASPTLKFEDFGMTAPSIPFRVVSVVDEIRLVVEIAATGPKS